MHAPKPCPRRVWFAVALALLSGVTAIAHAADGDPDPTFAGNGLAIHAWPVDTIQSEAESGAVAADGSVIAAGRISYPDGVQRRAVTLLRWRPDGTPDPGFGTAGMVRLDLDPTPQINEAIVGIYPQAGGKLLVLAGTQVAEAMATRPVLVSVNADGSPDTAYGPGGMRSVDIGQWQSEGDFQLRVAGVQPDGKILIGATLVTDDSYHILLGRVLPDAGLDTSFGVNGWRALGADSLGNWGPQAITVDDLGRILVAGQVDDGPTDYPAVFRVTASGAVDSSFGDPADGGAVVLVGLAGSWTARAVVATRRALVGGLVQRRIFLAISAGSPNRTAIVALANDGAIATGFGSNGYLDLTREQGSRITALAMRNDQRLVASGFIIPNGSSRADLYVARITFGGALDTGFDGNGVARYPIDADGISNDTTAALLLSGQRPVVIAQVYNNTAARYHTAALRLRSDHIFEHGFEFR